MKQNPRNTEYVWEQYRAAIKSFLHSKVSNTDDVDDLLQDILIKTHANLHTLKSGQSVKPWLFQIANRTIIDFYRKNAKQSGLHPEDLWYHENDTTIQQELAHCIEPFIRSLPPEHAALLTAIDIHGTSQKDYAANTGLSYSTLKSRVQKSRSLLRAQFSRCCELTLDKHGNVIDYESRSRHCDGC